MFPPNAKILVLDDMPGVRQMVRGLLKELGYTNVTLADDGQKGLELILAGFEKSAPFNLLISDWNMPNLSGIELLEKIRNHPDLANMPVLLVTAEGEFRQVKRAMELKVTEYLVKPFSKKNLTLKIANCWKKTGEALFNPKPSG